MSAAAKARDLVEVSERQVTAFRLGRQHLLERAQDRPLAELVGDVGGVQAQVSSAAEIGLWARRDGVTTAEVRSALEPRGSLVRAWCMRRTLHVLPSAELAMFVRGSSWRSDRDWQWLRGRGVPDSVTTRLVEAFLATLDEPRTLEDAQRALLRSIDAKSAKWRGGGWGNQRAIPAIRSAGAVWPMNWLLHLSGRIGIVCVGPPRDGEATYVRGDAWVAKLRDVDGPRAEEQLLRRYLGTFGPASPGDFAIWAGFRGRDAKAIWSRVEPAMVSVRAGARSGSLLRDDLSVLELEPPSEFAPRLLPYFDGYLLGHEERSHLVAPDRHREVYRLQGWIYPTVLVDGRVAGLWSSDPVGGDLRVRVQPFAPLPQKIVNRVRREADDLAGFLGCRRARLIVAARSRRPPAARRASSPRRRARRARTVK